MPGCALPPSSRCRSSPDADLPPWPLATPRPQVHRLVSALGLLLYKSPHTGELTPNLEVLDARSVLEGKLPLAARKDVRALVGEVAGQLC